MSFILDCIIVTLKCTVGTISIGVAFMMLIFAIGGIGYIIEKFNKGG